MNTLKGPLKIVSKEMGLIFHINAAVTIALFALFLFLSFRIDGNENLGMIFGPFYAIFLFYAFMFFKSYNYIISFGGTRMQFILSTFISTLIFLTVGTIILNALYILGEMIFQNGYIFHMADILNGANPAMYFWVDFLWLFILFGFGMFAQVINFNLGIFRTFSLLGVILLASIAIFFFADLTPLFRFIVTDHLLFIHILAILSLVLLALSAFMMRNAPLKRGDRKIFSTTATD